MRKLLSVVAIIVALCIAIGTTISIAYAQGETPETPQATATIGWIIVAWLFYTLLGLFAAASSGEKFDGMKFAKTLLITMIVAVVAFALKIPPAAVATQYGVVIDQIAIIIMNGGPGLMLIYSLEKLWKMISAWKTKWEQARQAATGPGPPTPTA